jgi:hypothetical protein
MTTTLSKIDAERRNLILDLWAAGTPTPEIADRVNAVSEEWVRGVVCRARTRDGDKRAIVRDAGIQRKRREAANIIPSDVIRVGTSYAGMSFTSILFGDPPPGRSALDQKRAGVGA